ncbi:hypothetical protein GGI42DRAFT_235726 [Trichoderma sp. SZMC 28013]
MEATLLSSLHTKLDDLEGKMLAYRYDLVSDFQRYYHDLLTGVNPSVATSIQQAISPSFANYPTLRPELEPELEAADSQPPDPAAIQQPPAPEVAARIEAPNSSSRERETELQGLFTPSYLPLLDSSPPYDRRPVATSTVASTGTTTSTQTALAFPLLPVMAPRDADNGTATDLGITVGGGLAITGNSETPADPQAPAEAHRLVRTTTEESTSSVNSDKSDSKTRRSALRRSSSISKPPQSPRRVRFEFMGAEVLPTSSPQQLEFITPAASEPVLKDEPIASDMILGDDIDEWEPPVRKSSSTEALRALSRAPAEEGTVWTVVNPDSDRPKSEQDGTSTPTPERPGSIEQPTSTANYSRIDTPSARVVHGGNATSINDVNNRGSENGKDADDSSDDEDEYLAMGKRKTSAAQKPALVSVAQLPAARVSNGLASATSTQDKPHLSPSDSSNPRESRNSAPVEDESVDDYGDDDDMFEFEPGGLSAPPKPRERPPLPPDEEEPSDDESQDDVPNIDRPSQPTLYSTSPAVSIARPRPENAMSTVSRFQPGSLGSYKGRPVIMPVVRNPEVHARAASLGQFNTFVGGLDGRSGMDEGDLSSFRASVVQPGFTGTPRSFTERFMMEEAQAERERNGAAQ